MPQVPPWWFVGGALISSLGVRLAWRALKDREIANYTQVIGLVASHYASRFFGTGGLGQVADHLRFARRPPRLPLRVVSRWRQQRAFNRGRTRRERKDYPVQHYLALTFAWQHNGELAVILEPAVGISVWHAFRDMAEHRGWPLADVESLPDYGEPDPDGATVRYFITADQSALVYMFANPGLLTRMRSRVTTISRYLRRVATRVWLAFRRVLRRAFRKSPRR